MQETRYYSAPTLRTIWKDYQLSRHLKPITVRNYNQRLNQHLADWLDIPARAISKDMVEERHREINGHAMANSTMRTLRALLHYAALRYIDKAGNPAIKMNPVTRLSELRAWYKDRHRHTAISIQQLPAWFQAVFSLEAQTVRDVLLTLIFLGLRKSEATNLQWENLDLTQGLLTLHDTKNGEDFTCPIPDYLWRLLRMRRQWSHTSYVFPCPYNRDAPIRLGSSSYQPVIKATGIHFSPHDLRRTFASVADELDIKNEVVAALLNHKPPTQTDRYIVRSMERLRRASNEIARGLQRYGNFHTP